MAKILIVDDEEMVRTTLRNMLTRAGHDVIESSDGREALMACEQVVPDLILLDLYMPEMDGFEVMTALRKSSPNVKLLAITGGSRYGWTDRLVDMASKLGAADVLLKPFTDEDVLQAVERAFASAWPG